MRYLGILISSIILLSACSKSPGVGGKATVSGIVNAIYVNEDSFDTVEVSGYPETRVYIVYGDGSTQDDDTRTSPDGSFKFEYLNPGDYKIYTYSESLLLPSEMEEVSAQVKVEKSQDDVTVPTLTVVKYVK